MQNQEAYGGLVSMSGGMRPRSTWGGKTGRKMHSCKLIKDGSKLIILGVLRKFDFKGWDIEVTWVEWG